MGDWFSYYMEQDRNEAAADAGLERTPLANIEYRAKTGELLKETKPSLRARLAKRLAEDPEGCECQTCVKNWEELG